MQNITIWHACDSTWKRLSYGVMLNCEGFRCQEVRIRIFNKALSAATAADAEGVVPVLKSSVSSGGEVPCKFESAQ